MQLRDQAGSYDKFSLRSKLCLEDPVNCMFHLKSCRALGIRADAELFLLILMLN